MAPSHSAAASPTVSCLMVTANRAHLCRRAVRCYNRQTYPARELVVIDDGKQDLTPVLQADELVYVKLERTPENVLGHLRNLALEHATGGFLVQWDDWDDDDWYHDTRIERQARVLQDGHDACSLYGALMHIDAPRYFLHPYVGTLPHGVPGSIMHRRSDAIRYPAMPPGRRHSVPRSLARAALYYAPERGRSPLHSLLPRQQHVGQKALPDPHAQHGA